MINQTQEQMLLSDAELDAIAGGDQLSLNGNDQITLNELNYTLPGVIFLSGSGNDFLIGGAGQDYLSGSSGNDTLR